MEIRRLDNAPTETSPVASGRLATGEGERPVAWQVAEETPIAILLNGSSFAVMMATPADLEDFAVGFALSEGIVPAIDRIDGLRIAEAGDGIVVNLRIDPGLAEAVAARGRTVPGRSGCGICGAQTIEAALPRPPKVSGRTPDSEALLRAYAALPAAQAMNRINRSIHAAAYCRLDGTIDCVREDIGRHNALDKLVGALTRDGRDARDGFILLSSRISVELVQKAAVARAPFLAAVSAPSALALRVADRAGMGLASRAPDGVMVFAPGRRVESAA